MKHWHVAEANESRSHYIQAILLPLYLFHDDEVTAYYMSGHSHERKRFHSKTIPSSWTRVIIVCASMTRRAFRNLRLQVCNVNHFIKEGVPLLGKFKDSSSTQTSFFILFITFQSKPLRDGLVILKTPPRDIRLKSLKDYTHTLEPQCSLIMRIRS